MKENEEEMKEYRAVRTGSRRKQRGSHGLPTISIEYMFIGDQQAREEEKDMPVLVTKNKRIEMMHELDAGEKTNEEEADGKYKDEQDVVELGENDWYLNSDLAGKDKYGSRWWKCIWSGIMDDMGETIVETDERAVSLKDFRSEPAAKELRNEEWLMNIIGASRKTLTREEGDELMTHISMPSDDEPLSEPVKPREELRKECDVELDTDKMRQEDESQMKQKVIEEIGDADIGSGGAGSGNVNGDCEQGAGDDAGEDRNRTRSEGQEVDSTQSGQEGR